MLVNAVTAGEVIEVPWNLVMWLCDRFTWNGTTMAAVVLGVGVLLCIAVPYLLGSINPAILFSKLIYHDDIRNHGSGNAGTTNMLRTFGLKAAGLTLLCDFLKAIVAVWVGRLIFAGIGGSIAGFFVVFGHMFPIYYRFKGGKGVACAGMVALAINPIIFLFLLFIFLVVAIGTRLVSLASVMCALFYPLLFNAFAKNVDLAVPMAFMITVFVIFMHRENLKRIWNHEEKRLDLSKFSLKKKKKKAKEPTEEKKPDEQK